MSKLHTRYQQGLYELEARRQRAHAKYGELEKALEAVEMITESRGDAIVVESQLADTLYVKFQISDPQRVCVWLGAGVALELNPVEARELLSGRIEDARKVQEESLKATEFFQRQSTICEVNLGRLMNLASSVNKVEQ